MGLQHRLDLIADGTRRVLSSGVEKSYVVAFILSRVARVARTARTSSHAIVSQNRNRIVGLSTNNFSGAGVEFHLQFSTGERQI